MINSVTYRFLASVLCWCFLLGMIMPANVHGMSMEECTSGMAMHAEHMTSKSTTEDCPMADKHGEKHQEMMHSNMDRFGFACACSSDLVLEKKDAIVLQKSNLQLHVVVKLLTEDHLSLTNTELPSINWLDSYAFPPIYLSNESLLI